MKMRFYAIDREHSIVTLNFTNEDKMEAAFSTAEQTSGRISDDTGQKLILDVSYGFSKDRLDFIKFEGKNLRKMDPLVERDIQGDM
jgi:hypothetical protein